MQRYRNNLALLWLIWSGGLVLFLVVRLVQQDGASAETVGWLSPHLAPTLSLVCSVAVIGQARAKSTQNAALRPAYLRALIASVLYLIVLTTATLTVPLTLSDASQTLAPFGAVLGVLQGAAAATLGIFFARPAASS